ncbi:MAG: hypothetical protein ACE5F1_08160 [Planctomycetota bacterium]
MFQSLFMTLVASLPGGGDGAEPPKVQGGMELRVFPVHSLVGAYRRDSLPPFGRLLERVSWDRRLHEEQRAWMRDDPPRSSDWFSADDSPPMAGDVLVELIVKHFGDRGFDAGKGRVFYHDRSVVAVQKAGLLDEIRGFLERMRLQVAPRIRYEYLLFEGKRSQAGGVAAGKYLLNGDAARALAARVRSGDLGGLIHESSAVGRPGDLVHLGELNRVVTQLDLNVEVANESSIADPIPRSLILGQGIGLQSVVCPDGRSLALFGLFTRRAVRGKVQTHDLVAKGLGMVEKVDIEELQSAFSLRLGEDGGVLLRPGRFTVLLLVTRLDPVPDMPSGEALLQTGLLASNSMTLEEMGLCGIEQKAPMEPDLLFETVRSLALDPEEEGSKLEIRVGSSHMLLFAEQQRISAARALLAYLSKDKLRGYVVELRREARPRDDESTGWQRLGPDVAIPCLGGRLGFAMDGREESFIGDYDVEIAQKQAIADPVPSSAWDGAQLVAAVDPVGEGCRVRIALLDRSLLELRRIQAGAPELGPISAPDSREVTMQRAFSMKPGETRVLGDGPDREIEGLGRCRTRLTLRLEEL